MHTALEKRGKSLDQESNSVTLDLSHRLGKDD